MVTVATWNVNSLKTRLDHLVTWLKATPHDVVLLQETKLVDDAFPRLEIEALGYHVAMKGQKTYNGVAVLSRHPIEVHLDHLPGDADDDQARYLEATTAGLRVAAIYLPNGNPTPGPKFTYKLDWMARLRDRARALLATEDAVVLGGDYNVAPEDGDCFDPRGWADDALCRPESRSAFRSILHLGYTEAFRALTRETGRYSWWDYRAGAWSRDQGVRIDHLLLSPQACDRLQSVEIFRKARGFDKPSDHVPVIGVFDA